MTVAMAMAILVTSVALRNVFEAAHRVIGWAVAATVVALLIRPVVEALSRWVPRVVALLFVGLVIGTMTGGVVYGVFDELQSETKTLRIRGPEAAERLAARDDRVGEVARDLRLPDRATDAFDALEVRFGVDADTITSAVGTVPAYFVGFILTMFLVLYGPAIVRGSLAQIDDEQRRREWTDNLDRGITRAQSYLWGALVQGAVVGLAIFSCAKVTDLPAPTVLGLVSGVAATLPYMGIVVGSIPAVLLAAGFESVTFGAWLFVAAAAAQVIEALLLRPLLDRKSLHVGPAVPVIVGVVGLELYGIGGALFGVAAVVMVLAIVDAATDHEEPVPLPADDFLERRIAPPDARLPADTPRRRINDL